VNYILLNALDLRDGDGHVLLAPQVAFTQYQVGDVTVLGIYQKLINATDAPVAGVHASAAPHGQLSMRYAFMSHGDGLGDLWNPVRPNHVRVFITLIVRYSFPDILGLDGPGRGSFPLPS